jgi:hypothetical protein
MLSIIEYLLYNGRLARNKKLLSFHQFLSFVFPFNFFRFWHFKHIISRNFDIFRNNWIGTTVLSQHWVILPFLIWTSMINNCFAHAIRVSSWPRCGFGIGSYRFELWTFIFRILHPPKTEWMLLGVQGVLEDMWGERWVRSQRNGLIVKDMHCDLNVS